jgi:hypothetical protein
MTDEARKVFVNAVAYIQQFDGRKQTVYRGVISRPRLRGIVTSSAVFRSQFNIDRYFSPDAVAKFGTDQAKYRAHYEANVDYIHVPAGRSGLRVDEEAKQLGIPNHDVRLLDRCVDMLEAGEQPALARTLLERYTGESFPTPQAWRAWLTKSRDRLFFLDGHGYRFFTDAPSAPPAKWQIDEALAEFKVADPTDTDPVSTDATVVSRFARNDKGATTLHMGGSKGVAVASPGDVVTLVVRMRVADPWHTYAKVPAGSPLKATDIDLKLPEGLRFVGDWKFPKAEAADTPGTTVYEGDLVFTRDVLVTVKSGTLSIEGTVRYQACDPEKCQPPRSETIKLAVQVTGR